MKIDSKFKSVLTLNVAFIQDNGFWVHRTRDILQRAMRYVTSHQGSFPRVFLITMTYMLSTINLTYAEESEAVKLDTEIKKASYGVGVKYGEGLQRDLNDLDLPSFMQGLSDAFEQKPLALEAEQINQAVTGYQQRKMAEQNAVQQEAAQKNLASGNAFLKENKDRKGIKVEKSGLQYEVLRAGDGEIPNEKDKVKVHYHGTLIDGTVFDSSVDRGEPIVFPVNGVIKGWTEALQLMKKGAKWKLYIPSDLAYGERGTRGIIGPNATLIFEVELIDIEKEG